MTLYILEWTYAHGCVERPCNVVVLLKPWAATQDLWKPESANSALHVANLSL